MTDMLRRHKVADYSNWKRVLDSHSAAHEKVGLRAEKVLRNLGDPNEVFLFFEVTDLEKARRFVSSAEVPQAKQPSRVVGNPDIYFSPDGPTPRTRGLDTGACLIDEISARLRTSNHAHRNQILRVIALNTLSAGCDIIRMERGVPALPHKFGVHSDPHSVDVGALKG